MAKRATQERLPGISNELEKAIDKFIDNKTEIADLKLEQEKLTEAIIVEMKKDGKTSVKVSHGGENYVFKVLKGEDDLRVAKVTKTPVDDSQPDLDGVEK